MNYYQIFLRGFRDKKKNTHDVHTTSLDCGFFLRFCFRRLKLLFSDPRSTIWYLRAISLDQQQQQQKPPYTLFQSLVRIASWYVRAHNNNHKPFDFDLNAMRSHSVWSVFAKLFFFHVVFRSLGAHSLAGNRQLCIYA